MLRRRLGKNNSKDNSRMLLKALKTDCTYWCAHKVRDKDNYLCLTL